MADIWEMESTDMVCSLTKRGFGSLGLALGVSYVLGFFT